MKLNIHLLKIAVLFIITFSIPVTLLGMKQKPLTEEQRAYNQDYSLCCKIIDEAIQEKNSQFFDQLLNPTISINGINRHVLKDVLQHDTNGFIYGAFMSKNIDILKKLSLCMSSIIFWS